MIQIVLLPTFKCAVINQMVQNQPLKAQREPSQLSKEAQLRCKLCPHHHNLWNQQCNDHHTEDNVNKINAEGRLLDLKESLTFL